MTRSIWVLCLAGALAAAGAANAAPAPAKAVRTKRPTAVAKPATKAVAKLPPAPAMPRTLEDVRIEGEVPVPQVLFITARDQRRFMDFQHHRYLKNSEMIGDDTPFPTWVAVIHGSPTIPGKEPSR
jgi:hypothetical protein